MRNPLNSSEVSGNSVAYLADQDRGNTASHKDMYKCDCGLVVPEKEWDLNKKNCFLCAEGI